MRIRNIHIEESKIFPTRGIKGISLSKLGQVVALVGRNGSGKSRILNTIADKQDYEFDLYSLRNSDIFPIPDEYKDTITLDRDINNYIDLSYKHKKGGLSPSELRSINVQMNNFFNTKPNKLVIENQMKVLINRISGIDNKVKSNILKISNDDIRLLSNVNDSSISFEDIIENIKPIVDNSELKSIRNSALKYLNKLPHELLNEFEEAFGKEDVYQSTIPFRRFSNLKNKISLFLQKELDWKKRTSNKQVTENGLTAQKNGYWIINNRPFNYQEFSDGEKVLFAYALLFFLLEINNNTPIRNSVILIDEPELNLHPESEIQLIDSIREMIGDSGQLWIATHSLNIISSLNYEDIYIVKDGSILDKRNTTPTDAINELINLNTNLERIKLFLSSIDQWAFANFTVQCFKDPETISTTNINDPQFLLFKKALQEYPKLDLLDFGAGTGRVYKTLMEDDVLKAKIKYSSFEINPDSIEELKKVGIGTIYSSLAELSGKKYDVILLCNVLHEVGLSYWSNTLNQLRASLTENGFLIILEDLELPKGEQIEEAGFLIMSKEELGLLFNIGEDAIRIELDTVKYKDRISCCIIPKVQAKDVTNDTIKNALEKLMHNSWKNYNTYKIKKTTDPKEQHHYGRKLALYSQLYLNAKRGLELIDEKYKELTVMNEGQKN